MFYTKIKSRNYICGTKSVAQLAPESLAQLAPESLAHFIPE